MNKIVLLVLISGLLMTSCTDESLDTQPNDRYTEDNYWTSEKNAAAAVVGCYAALRTEGMFGGEGTPLLEESATPNAYNYNDRLGFDAIAKGTHTASNSAIINTRWGACYTGVGRCNTLLARIDGIVMDNDLKERLKAEAKFLRALYYSVLAIYYKDAPLILDEPSIEQASLPRTPHTEIIAQVIKDLDEAAGVLPAKYKEAADLGRATAGAALALKARVLLFEASPLINADASLNEWAEAAKAAKAVIDLPGTGYDLFPNYRQLFLPANENKQETVFDVQFKIPEQGSSFDVVGSQYNDNAPVQGLIEAYDMSDGLPQSVSPLYNPANPYANRDPRFYQTVVYPGSTFQGATVTKDRFKITGYGIKKYTVYDNSTSPTIAGGRSEINYMLIRYADVLLMYAEAQNEAVGPDPSVYDAVERIRQRAGLVPYQLPVGLTQPQMREIIRHERRIEFAGEGFYYNDIRRWKTAEDLMSGPIFGSDQTLPLINRRFNPDRDYWWPVPQVQRDRNPNLSQNDEYGG